MKMTIHEIADKLRSEGMKLEDSQGEITQASLSNYVDKMFAEVKKVREGEAKRDADNVRNRRYFADANGLKSVPDDLLRALGDDPEEWSIRMPMFKSSFEKLFEQVQTLREQSITGQAAGQSAIASNPNATPEQKLSLALPTPKPTAQEVSLDSLNGK